MRKIIMRSLEQTISLIRKGHQANERAHQSIKKVKNKTTSICFRLVNVQFTIEKI